MRNDEYVTNNLTLTYIYQCLQYNAYNNFLREVYFFLPRQKHCVLLYIKQKTSTRHIPLMHPRSSHQDMDHAASQTFHHSNALPQQHAQSHPLGIYHAIYKSCYCNHPEYHNVVGSWECCFNASKAP